MVRTGEFSRKVVREEVPSRPWSKSGIHKNLLGVLTPGPTFLPKRYRVYLLYHSYGINVDETTSSGKPNQFFVIFGYTLSESLYRLHLLFLIGPSPKILKYGR